ncbi:MAG: phosphatidate cytidylyltransferase [Bdellovibrionales bacterium]
MSSLTLRIISALVLLGMAVGIYLGFGNLGITILIYISISISQVEFMGLCLTGTRKLFRAGFLALSQVYLILSLALPALKGVDPTKTAIQLFVFICFIGLISPKDTIKETRDDIFAATFGFFYLSIIPSLLLLTLNKNPDLYLELFSLLLVTVFAGDTFAYFSGLLFGKKKVLPLISPKKTIVGCVGGLLGSVLIGTTFYYLFISKEIVIGIPVMCFLMGLYGQTGDFLESLLKRISGKKDSSRLIPGHGGVLDRIDGVLLAIPALYLYFF